MFGERRTLLTVPRLFGSFGWMEARQPSSLPTLARLDGVVDGSRIDLDRQSCLHCWRRALRCIDMPEREKVITRSKLPWWRDANATASHRARCTRSTAISHGASYIPANVYHPSVVRLGAKVARARRPDCCSQSALSRGAQSRWHSSVVQPDRVICARTVCNARGCEERMWWLGTYMHSSLRATLRKGESAEQGPECAVAAELVMPLLQVSERNAEQREGDVREGLATAASRGRESCAAVAAAVAECGHGTAGPACCVQRIWRVHSRKDCRLQQGRACDGPGKERECDGSVKQ